MDEALQNYLRNLEYRALKAGDAHHRASRYFEFIDTWTLAIPSLIASFIATLLAFAVLNSSEPGGGPRAAAAVVVAIATLLTGIRNQVKADGRAVAHRRSGVAYNSVRRHAATVCATSSSQREDVDTINAKYDEAGQLAPIVPGFIWRRTEKSVKNKRPDFSLDLSVESTVPSP